MSVPRKTTEERITVVQMGCNQSVCENSSAIGIVRRGYSEMDGC